MQRQSGFVLLIIFLGGALISPPVVRYMRVQARRQMHRLVRSRDHGMEVQRFTFPCVQGEVIEPGFSWEERGHEFRFKGTLYDVLRSTSASGSLTLHCVSDERESHLDRIERTLAGSPNDRQITAVLKFLAERFIPTADPQLPNPVWLLATYGRSTSDLACARFATVPTPPPRA